RARDSSRHMRSGLLSPRSIRWIQRTSCPRLVLGGAVFALITIGIARAQAGNQDILPSGRSGANGKVNYERILGAAREPSNLLTYSGRYLGWRYSTLDQINADNVSRLRMEWTFQVGDLGQFETTPLVVDGILYGTGQNNRAFAVDARTGRAIW